MKNCYKKMKEIYDLVKFYCKKMRQNNEKKRKKRLQKLNEIEFWGVLQLELMKIRTRNIWRWSKRKEEEEEEEGKEDGIWKDKKNKNEWKQEIKYRKKVWLNLIGI